MLIHDFYIEISILYNDESQFLTQLRTISALKSFHMITTIL